jgi:hypothetical protein
MQRNHSSPASIEQALIYVREKSLDNVPDIFKTYDVCLAAVKARPTIETYQKVPFYLRTQEMKNFIENRLRGQNKPNDPKETALIDQQSQEQSREQSRGGESTEDCQWKELYEAIHTMVEDDIKFEAARKPKQQYLEQKNLMKKFQNSKSSLR